MEFGVLVIFVDMDIGVCLFFLDPFIKYFLLFLAFQPVFKAIQSSSRLAVWEG